VAGEGFGELGGDDGIWCGGQVGACCVQHCWRWCQIGCAEPSKHAGQQRWAGGEAEAGGSSGKPGCGLGQARRPAGRRVLACGVDGADGLPESGQVGDVGFPVLVEVPVGLAADGEQIVGGGAGFAATA
jgi:hypothetical protein